MAQKTKLITLFVLYFLSISSLTPVLAQERGLEVDYPEVFGDQPQNVTTLLPEYVKYLFGLGIWLVGLVAFGAMVWGGIIWLTASGSPEKIKEGRDRITSAFLGIIILLASYIILNIINPQLISFDVRPLLGIPTEPRTPPPPLEPDEITLIAKEIPLGQVLERGVWEQERTNRIRTIFEQLNAFLQEEITNNPRINRISDLQKYLKKLTEDCQCGLMDAFSAGPWQGGGGVACTGEPCPEENLEKIREILDVNEEKVRRLVGFRQLLAQEKELLETALSRLADIEQDINDCQNASGGIYSLAEYSNLAQFYEDSGSKTATIENPYYASRADPLTFYCPTGGTAFDFPYAAEVDLSLNEPIPFEASADFAFEQISCPVEIPVGEVLDGLRQEAILLSIKMEKSILLIDDLTRELARISDLIDQFNGSQCEVSTGCFRPPFFFFLPCLQVLGSCTGTPGPRDELADAVQSVKEAEDELLLTIEQTKEIFPKVDFLIRSPQNPINLQNVRTSVQLASSPYKAGEFGPEQDWVLLNCEEAVGNVGPDGLTIASCQPRNFYACTSTGATEPAFPSVIKDRPATIIPEKQYEPLEAASDNCPEGWLCNRDVTFYNQYTDASEPVKQLLSCMRQRLDRVEEEKELEGTLGRITSISDSKLTIGTCDWGAGPSEPGGCSHTYTVRQGRESVSAHYGGSLCRYQKTSYAIDVGAREPLEKRYAEEIIAAAKECAPAAWIGYQIPGHYEHIHISIGRVNQCGAN
ncbi:MAG: hypothetical protein G01um101430_74 [Parcubacteria group bacterium Gr01-1014_30]|nr:MAG: hypothetical protein G01um101430_74 [Parcubacteria group bacterium Gr01-1014_30]